MNNKSGKSKLRIKVASAVVLVVGSFLFGMSLTEKGFASSPQPGSPSDPLVSQSYVDAKFNQLQTQISSIVTSGGTSGGLVLDTATNLSPEVKDSIIRELMSQIDYLYGQSAADQSLYLSQPVFVEAGNVVIGGEGTEMILRSGEAVGFVPGVNGLSNVTNGTDIMNNGYIPMNNLIFVPRDDGRGVLAVTDVWIMIKGSYNILR